jgi:hypothetical protein
VPGRRARHWIGLFLLIAAAAAVIAATSSRGIDYGSFACHSDSDVCDEAGYPLRALIHGDLGAFFAQQPLMGPASLLLRAPLVALSRLGSPDFLTEYRLGVFACLLVSGLVALKVGSLMFRRGQPPARCALIAALMFANPAVFHAIDLGHPEEFVTAAACVMCVVLLLERRLTASAVLLGLAVASKPWALLIALPVLLAVMAPARRRFLVVAALTTLALYAPMVLGDPARFADVVKGAGQMGSRPGNVTPANVWWFEATFQRSSPRIVGVQNGELIASVESGYALPLSLDRVAHLLLVVVTLVLGVAWYRSGARSQAETLLLLSAVVFLVRCVLDPGSHSYYHAPAIASLLAYEGLARRGIPWASLLLIAALWATARLPGHVMDRTLAVVYLGWAVPAVLLGLWLLFRRSRLIALT